MPQILAITLFKPVTTFLFKKTYKLLQIGLVIHPGYQEVKMIRHEAINEYFEPFRPGGLGQKIK